MRNVRAFFKKTGTVRYISHLDLARAVTRALLRSGLPISYSEGFNPHPKLVFALPLSIFQESEYEAFDFKLDTDCDPEFIENRLRAALPVGISIFKIAEPIQKCGNVSFALYRIILKTDCKASEIESLFTDEMTVMKKTKSGSAMVNIAPMIKEKSIVGTDKGEIILKVKVCSSSDCYLNPQYIINYFGERIYGSSIKRLMLYNAAGEIFN